MPSDLFLKTANVVHKAMLTASGGRIGWEAAKMPVVKLTTVGRKSGEKRTVMLTSPHRDGDTIAIVASKGGDPQHPAWFLNLQANPTVEVETKGQPRRTMTARVATADERALLWPTITKTYTMYADYQTKTEREIPVVLLAPAT